MKLADHAKTPVEISVEYFHIPFDPNYPMKWVPLDVAEAEIQRFRDKNAEFIRDIGELNGKIAEAQKILDSILEDKITTTLCRADLLRLRFTLSSEQSQKEVEK